MNAQSKITPSINYKNFIVKSYTYSYSMQSILSTHATTVKVTNQKNNNKRITGLTWVRIFLLPLNDAARRKNYTTLTNEILIFLVL